MAFALTLEEAKEKALYHMHHGYHWGPSVLQVMWEAEGLGNDDNLWASINFFGGISGHQDAPCGVVSSATVCLGLRYRCPIENKEMAKEARINARRDANELVQGFKEKFGDITCLGLLGVSFSDAERYRTLRESGALTGKCEGYLTYVIEKLYELAGEK